MTLTELIYDLQTKPLVEVGPLRMKAPPKKLDELFHITLYTKPEETDFAWWGKRIEFRRN